MHPFHVHSASFRILSFAGMTRPAHLAGRKDVILVEDKAELLVAFSQPATREHPFVYYGHMILTTIKAAGIGSAYPLPNS
jgi:FtsP/CotA-like multicopper oxidase with cupredoxin domain